MTMMIAFFRVSFRKIPQSTRHCSAHTARSFTSSNHDPIIECDNWIIFKATRICPPTVRIAAQSSLVTKHKNAARERWEKNLIFNFICKYLFGSTCSWVTKSELRKIKIKQISLCVERIVCERIEIMWRSHVAVELELALRKEIKKTSSSSSRYEWQQLCSENGMGSPIRLHNQLRRIRKSFTVSRVRYEKESQSPSHLTLIAFLALFMCDEWELTFQS